MSFIRSLAWIGLGIWAAALAPQVAQAGEPTPRERAIYRHGFQRGYEFAKARALPRIYALAEENARLRAQLATLQAQAEAPDPGTGAGGENSEDSSGTDDERPLVTVVPVVPVERDVAVARSAVREGVGVGATWVGAVGDNLEAGRDAVGTVAGGYVDAVRGLGEERSLPGHVRHTVETVAGGWVEGGRRFGGQVLEGYREVGGRIVEGAQGVGETWVEATGEIFDAARAPFGD
jgi:hypothetical protein